MNPDLKLKVKKAFLRAFIATIIYFIVNLVMTAKLSYVDWKDLLLNSIIFFAIISLVYYFTYKHQNLTWKKLFKSIFNRNKLT